MSLACLRDALPGVIDFPTLLRTLRDCLHWPVNENTPFDDAVFDYSAAEAGISVSREDQIKRVAQLAPIEDNDWGIFFVDFGETPLRREILRLILRAFVTKKRDAGEMTNWPMDRLMFICRHGVAGGRVSPTDRPTFTFCHYIGGEYGRAKLKTFSWTNPRESRTVCERNLTALQWSSWQNWGAAWNVEQVTKDFFEEFRTIFRECEPEIKLHATSAHTEEIPFPAGSEGGKTAFLQRIANRLLFIVFLQRRDWLKLGGERSTEYLFDLYDLWRTKPDAFAGIADFHQLLTILFFEALNEPDEAKRRSREHLIGEIPFLNGGLFHREEFESEAGPVATPPASFYSRMLGDDGLLRRYNFTVIENFDDTDQDVAIDPEMLGKIFEELITVRERHGRGSYYTPRPIVAFMCREALKGYLADGGLDPDKIERLVDDHLLARLEAGTEHDALTPREVDTALDLIKAVKVADPACGSGAYLLGMLRELYELSALLEKRREPANAKERYGWKLDIIRQNLYGVDIDPIAINIARLRLWLSLAVDYDGQIPQPLPNLDLKIEQGDSLLAPDPQTILKPEQLTFISHHVQDYIDGKKLYFDGATAEIKATGYAKYVHARGEIEAELYVDLDKINADIARWQAEHDRSTGQEKYEAHHQIETLQKRLKASASKPTQGAFDWLLTFLEVFVPEHDPAIVGGSSNLGIEAASSDLAELASPPKAGGFDIVLANPPYVNSGELLATKGKQYKARLVASYPDTGNGSADLYIYFYDRGIQLLRRGGMFAYISSNKWLKSEYGEKLRAYLSASTALQSITDFGDLPVFQKVLAYPVIIVASKRKAAIDESPVYTAVANLEEPYPAVKQVIADTGFVLPAGAVDAGAWTLAGKQTLLKMQRMKMGATPLREYVVNQIYSGIKTGCNEAFIINSGTRDSLVAADPKSAEIIKPLAAGKHLRRWRSPAIDAWIIATKIGTPMRTYPAVMAHLDRFKEKLSRRQDQGDHWWELRPCSYYDVLEGAKLVSTKVSSGPTFSIDMNGTYLLNTSYGFVVREPSFILSLLNSSVSSMWCHVVFQDKQNAYEVQPEPLASFPVPNTTASDKAALEALADGILDAMREDPAADVSDREAEINDRVEFLYFHQIGDETYDQWRGRLAAEAETEICEVRALIERGETSTIEFKQSLEYVDPEDPKILAAPAGQARENKLADTRKEVTHSALKSICGFLNAAGGTLLVGVHDKLGAVGIEPDFSMISNPKEKDADGWERKFRGLLDHRLNHVPLGLLEFSFPKIDGKTVARIVVKASNEPYYLEDVYFYRHGNQTYSPKPQDRDARIQKQRRGE
jgi:hypothetical protein